MSTKFRGPNSLEKNYSKLDPSTRWKEAPPSGGSTSIRWNASIWWKLTTTDIGALFGETLKYYISKLRFYIKLGAVPNVNA